MAKVSWAAGKLTVAGLALLASARHAVLYLQL